MSLATNHPLFPFLALLVIFTLATLQRLPSLFAHAQPVDLALVKGEINESFITSTCHDNDVTGQRNTCVLHPQCCYFLCGCADMFCSCMTETDRSNFFKARGMIYMKEYGLPNSDGVVSGTVCNETDFALMKIEQDCKAVNEWYHAYLREEDYREGRTGKAFQALQQKVRGEKTNLLESKAAMVAKSSAKAEVEKNMMPTEHKDKESVNKEAAKGKEKKKSPPVTKGDEQNKKTKDKAKENEKEKPNPPAEKKKEAPEKTEVKSDTEKKKETPPPTEGTIKPSKEDSDTTQDNSGTSEQDKGTSTSSGGEPQDLSSNQGTGDTSAGSTDTTDTTHTASGSTDTSSRSNEAKTEAAAEKVEKEIASEPLAPTIDPASDPQGVMEEPKASDPMPSLSDFPQ